MKNVKKGLILFSILILPALAYLLLTTGRNNYVRLPIFGPKQLDAHGDTIYHTVPDFQFTDQTGKFIALNNLKNKVFVADFFFSTCPTICPKMSGQLQRIQEKFKAQRDLKIISYTVNPEYDTEEVLEKYGKQFLINPAKWHLLTGKKKDIYNLARNGYFITAMEGDGGPDDFIHSEKFVLVDKEKRIRGYYDGTDPKDVDRLIDEIKVLLVEYKRNESSI